MEVDKIQSSLVILVKQHTFSFLCNG